MLLALFCLSLIGLFFVSKLVPIVSYAQLIYAYIVYRFKMFLINTFELGKLSEIKPSRSLLGEVELSYYTNDNSLYKIIITKPKRGPRPISKMVYRPFQNISRDVTEEMRVYMGPYGNFHGCPVTPRLLGLTDGELEVYYSQGCSKIFQLDETITLS